QFGGSGPDAATAGGAGPVGRPDLAPATAIGTAVDGAEGRSGGGPGPQPVAPAEADHHTSRKGDPRTGTPRRLIAADRPANPPTKLPPSLAGWSAAARGSDPA